MSHIEITIGQLLEQIQLHEWNHWVYVVDPDNVSPKTVCFVIDVDNADLEDDDFTPSIAALNGLSEFLSVQDIQDVRGYLANVGVSENPKAELFAVQYYFKWDAYPSERALAELD